MDAQSEGAPPSRMSSNQLVAVCPRCGCALGAKEPSGPEGVSGWYCVRCWAESGDGWTTTANYITIEEPNVSECTCGHTEDEHSLYGDECLVMDELQGEQCACIHFEAVV